ncbi:MAG: 4Fe-4S ferredoxin, partial [Deltaproteobacteria bacterium]
PEAAQSARPWLLGIGAPLAIGAAVYTAFLFGQAEGRDLWQSPLLPLHLLVQAAFAGAAAVLVTGAVLPLGEGLVVAARWTLGVALVADLFVLLLGEVAMPHASEVAARAAHRITHGPYRWHFWGGSLVAGHLLPLVLLALPAPAVGALAGLFVLVGLYLYEHAFVMAPQEIPNS